MENSLYFLRIRVSKLLFLCIMSQNWRKIAKMLHNAAKKFDWAT